MTTTGRSTSRAVFAIAWLVAACGQRGTPGEQSWQDFLAASTSEYEGKTIYRIQEDISVSLEELRAYYDESSKAAPYDAEPSSVAVNRQPLTVNVYNGADDIWPARDAMDITYCVSTEFGTARQRAIDEMAAATAAWAEVASVAFRYVNTGNCTPTNTGVDFYVRPWTSSGACAFFPSGGGCVARTLVMNFNYFDNSGLFDYTTTTGVFKHELGHVLGFRHEHVRSGDPGCTENSSWRAVNAYDNLSVMHYRDCGVSAFVELEITALDADGAESLYPQPCEVVLNGVTNDDGTATRIGYSHNCASTSFEFWKDSMISTITLPAGSGQWYRENGDPGYFSVGSTGFGQLRSVGTGVWSNAHKIHKSN